MGMILVWDITDNKPISVMGKEMAQAFGWRKIPWSRWKTLNRWCSKQRWNFQKVGAYVVRVKPVIGIWDGEEIWCHPDVLRELGQRLVKSEVKLWSRGIQEEIAACEEDLAFLEGKFK